MWQQCTTTVIEGNMGRDKIFFKENLNFFVQPQESWWWVAITTGAPVCGCLLQIGISGFFGLSLGKGQEWFLGLWGPLGAP